MTWILLAAAALAATPSTAGINLARGRPYRLEPKPDYVHCTEPGDATQLTDGVYANGHFWTRKETVGWNHEPMVQITVDLGRVEPIRGASFSTAAGTAGVGWPAAIQILVSDDGRRYHAAGELVQLSAATGGLPPAEGYRVHRYVTDQLATRGRWVKFVIDAGSPFIFADEVEVVRGAETLLAKAPSGEPITDVKAHYLRGRMRACITRRLMADADAVGAALAEAPVDAARRTALQAELKTAATSATALPDADPAAFRVVLPLNEPHAQIFRVQAALWRAAGCAPLTVWTAPLWDPLSMTTAPPAAPAPPRLAVAMMTGEPRHAAFNLSNAGEADADLRLRVEGLPGGDNPDWIAVHGVAWTDTKRGIPVADALEPAAREGRDFVVRVPRGMTRMVWLTLEPRTVPAGVHEGRVLVRGGGSGDTAVPLRVRVSALRFPARPSLSLGGWDYTDTESHYSITPGNRDAVIAFLRRYGVDTPWATAAVLPREASPDFAKLDEWVRRWAGARHWRVFLSVRNSFGDAKAGTAEFDARVGAWIRVVADHWRGLGLEPARLGLLLVDEPHEAAQDATIIAWAKAIRAAETGILIWEDPTWKDPSQSKGVFELCDVLCPNRPMFLAGGPAFQGVYTAQRAAGRTLNFYSCSGPVRLLDPYSYHRLQAWTCWREQAPAEFFWAFGDAGGGSAWNEYAAPGTCYTPLFLDASGASSSRHMEAVREGLGDHAYLSMLRDRIAEVEKAGRSSPALAAAKALLAAAPARVLDAPGAGGLSWAAAKERGVADAVRVELLDALESLRN
jgi:hypothetical protein